VGADADDREYTTGGDQPFFFGDGGSNSCDFARSKVRASAPDAFATALKGPLVLAHNRPNHIHQTT
jgi:hypothetical protein